MSPVTTLIRAGRRSGRCTRAGDGRRSVLTNLPKIRHYGLGGPTAGGLWPRRRRWPRCGSRPRAWRRGAPGEISRSPRRPRGPLAISRLVRPSASSTSTSRSRDVSTSTVRSSSAGSATAPESAPCRAATRSDRPCGPRRRRRRARRRRPTASAIPAAPEPEEIAHDVLLGGREQHHDLRVRTKPHQTADDVGDVEVGRRTDDDQIGPLDAAEADQLAPRPGLRDDLDPARLEHRGNAGADEPELVRDDRALATQFRPGSSTTSCLPALVICGILGSAHRSARPLPRKAVVSFNPVANQAPDGRTGRSLPPHPQQTWTSAPNQHRNRGATE